jgi:hypothetical protein
VIKLWSISILCLMLACSKTISGQFEVDKPISFIDTNGNLMDLSPGDYDVIAEIKKGSVLLKLNINNKENGFLFTGPIDKPKPGEIDIVVKNNNKEFRMRGEYSYEEIFLGKARDIRSCVRNGSTGSIYEFYDEYEIKEYVDVYMYEGKRLNLVGHILMEKIETTRLNINESTCM